MIGGGPAGATLASRLARLGHDVCVIERRRSIRDSVYESLSAGIVPLLDCLGLRDRIGGAPFRESPPVLLRWSGEVETSGSPDGPKGFLVDRVSFDEMLLERARAAGANVLQPATALPVRRDESGGWRIPLRSGSRSGVLLARFLVDASGRHSIIPCVKQRASVSTIALTGLWRGQEDPWNECRVESGSEQWYWGVPHCDGRHSATIFLDPKRCSGSGGARLEVLYRSLLAESVLLRGCATGELVGSIKARDATCLLDHMPIGDSFIKVGEAAFSIDPLSSQGVQTAMTTALQAGLVVHTILRRPGQAAAAAEFYRERQRESLAQPSAVCRVSLCASLGANQREFWSRRAAKDDFVSSPPPDAALRPGTPLPAIDLPVRLSDRARLTGVAAAVSDFIEVVPGLVHPSFDRPIAFLGGYPVAPLVAAMEQGPTVRAVVRALGRSVPERAAIEILQWAWLNGVLLPAHSDRLPAEIH